MKATLAVVGLVLFVALAECRQERKKPKTHAARAQEGKSGFIHHTTEPSSGEHQHTTEPSSGDHYQTTEPEVDSNQEGDGSQWPQWPTTEPEMDSNEEGDGPQWPYGWMEFAALYAKCESGTIMIDEIAEVLAAVGLNVNDSVLIHACPHVLESGKALMGLDELGRIIAEPFLALAMPVTQCANLIAEKESLVLTILQASEKVEESEFLNEAADLFDICHKLFEGADELEEKLSEEEEAAVGAVEDAKAAEDAKRSLRQLLAHFRK